ncbi:sigma-70 family RNA polymerase sigma factor [Caulobacter segnis]
MQEVFERLLSLRGPGGRAGPGALYLRGRRQRPVAPASPPRAWQALDDIGDLAPPDELTPERSLIGKEGVEAMLAVLDDLPDRTRHIFLLHRFEEMTYQRIARELGISVSAVEKHMMSALKALFTARRARSMSAALKSRAAEVAAKWFARHRAGPLTPDDRAAFQAWPAADPGNREAFETASDPWGGFDDLRTNPRLMRLREEARSAVGRRRTRRWVAAIAASATVVLGGAACPTGACAP